MEPFTIGLAISGILGLGNAVANLAGGAAQREAEGRAYDFNSRELERSAKLEDANAVDALARGSSQAGRLRQRGTQLQAEQALAYANSGVDSTVGTPAQVQSATGNVSELDALTTENNALREAWGHKEVGRKYRAQKVALAEEYAAGGTKQALNTASTLLGTAGGLASSAASLYARKAG